MHSDAAAYLAEITAAAERVLRTATAAERDAAAAALTYLPLGPTPVDLANQIGLDRADWLAARD
jgi:hypothetical protein